MTGNEIYQRKLEEILLNTPTSTGFNVSVSALLATFVYMTLDTAILYIPVIVMAVVQAIRVYIYTKARPFLIDDENAPASRYDLFGWSNGYWYATIATACIWASMSVITILTGTITEITFAMVVMAGICAGAVGTMSALIKFFAPYVLITIGPTILLMLFSGEQIQQFLAICGSLFGAFLLSTSVNAHHRFESNTSQFFSRARQLNKLQARATKLDRYAKEMKRVSQTDDLTGVSNRRHLEAVLNSEFELARQKMRPLSLVMCDIDKFKNINDTHGHHAGDASLKQVAKLLVNEIDINTDMVARLGGDEFVVVLPGKPVNLAEEFVHQMEAKLLREHPRKDSPSITMTFGISFTLGMPSDSPKQLMRRADEALYEAKRRGQKYYAKEGGTPGSRPEARH
jgi:diguanylate cyclase (GGDEF)-like protein